MERQNFEVSLRALVRRTPFRPFIVELVNGTRIQVQHPEALVFRGRVAVLFDTDGEIRLFDHEGVNQLSTQTDQAASA